MAKNLAFLSVGIAIGFLLSKAWDRVVEAANDPHRLADSIDEQLAELESQFA